MGLRRMKPTKRIRENQRELEFTVQRRRALCNRKTSANSFQPHFARIAYYNLAVISHSFASLLRSFFAPFLPPLSMCPTLLHAEPPSADSIQKDRAHLDKQRMRGSTTHEFVKSCFIDSELQFMSAACKHQQVIYNIE